jgi:hypothetical protein
VKKVPTALLIAGGVITASAVALAVGSGAPTTHVERTSAQAPVRTETQGSAATTAVAPKAYTLKIVGQYQSKNSWCVPTASSISLRSFGIKVSQTTLAKKMGTTSKGTWAKTAVPVLNSYVRSKTSTYRTGDDISSGSKLMNLVAGDVGVLHRATVLGVWIDDLPWSGKGWKNNTGHAIVVYGYNKTKGTITVWDPWKMTNGKKTGGTHVISAKKLAAVSQKGGMYYITHRIF